MIFDRESGARWFETGLNLIDGIRCQATLYAALDFGPIGYPVALWMFGDALWLFGERVGMFGRFRGCAESIWCVWKVLENVDNLLG